MSNLAKTIADLTSSDPNGSARIVMGVCQSIDWAALLTVVTVTGGTDVTARMAGQVPRVGENVWVLIVGDGALTIGRPSQPPLAKVTTVPDGSDVRVLGDDGITYVAKYPTGYAPAPGDRVLMNWDAGPQIVVRVSGEATPVTPTPPPTNLVSKQAQFLAADSGSLQSSWQSGFVYFGEQYTSAGFFYGTQIQNTIPDDATIDSVQIYLAVTAASGLSTMPLSLHDSLSRPDGPLDLDNDVDLGEMPDGFAGLVDLPTGWGDLLKTGARAGVGTSGPGYRRLQGKSQLAVAGALTIKWRE